MEFLCFSVRIWKKQFFISGGSSLGQCLCVGCVVEQVPEIFIGNRCVCVTFRPHSTDSFTHRKMTLSLADRSNKAQKVKVLPIAGKDPDAQRSEMIKVVSSYTPCSMS